MLAFNFHLQTENFAGAILYLKTNQLAYSYIPTLPVFFYKIDQ